MSTPFKRSFKKNLAYSILVAFLCMGLVGLFRIFYFTDSHIKTIIQEHVSQTIGTPVTIDDLKLSTFTGFTLTNLIVNAPKPYKHPIATIGKIHLSYDLWRLLLFEVVISDFSIHETSINIESLDGTSFAYEHILEHLSKDSTTDEEPEESSKELFALPQLPDLPVSIKLSNIELDNLSIALYTPSQEINFTSLSTKLSATFDDGQIKAHTSLGIGKNLLEPAHVEVTLKQNKTLAFYTKIWLNVALNTQSIANHELNLTGFLKTYIQDNQHISSPDLNFELHTVIDLSHGTISIDNAQVSFYETSIAQAQLSLKNIFTTPLIDIEQLNADIPIKECMQIARPFIPHTMASGSIILNSQPAHIALPLQTKQQPLFLTLGLHNIELDSHDFNTKIKQLNLTTQLNLTASHVKVDATLFIKSLLHEKLKLSNFNLGYQVSTPQKSLHSLLQPDTIKGISDNNHQLIMDFKTSFRHLVYEKQSISSFAFQTLVTFPIQELLTGTKDSRCTIESALSLASVEMPEIASIKDITINNSSELPLSFLISALNIYAADVVLPFNKQPFTIMPKADYHTVLKTRIASISMPHIVAIENVMSRFSALGTDPTGNQAHITALLNIPTIRVPLDAQTIVEFPLYVSSTIKRFSEQKIAILKCDADLSPLAKITARFEADKIFTPIPTIDLHSSLTLESLNNIWQWLPDSIKKDVPLNTIDGNIIVDTNLKGSIPLNELERLTKGANIKYQGLANLQPAFDTISKGLPFAPTTTITWNHLDLKSEFAHIQNLTGSLTFAILENIPSLKLRNTIKHLILPGPQETILSDVEIHGDVTEHNALFKSKLITNIASIAHEQLADNAIGPFLGECNLSAQYGGDVNFMCHHSLPRNGIALTSRWFTRKPHLILYNRSWTKPDLPGIDLLGSLELDIDSQTPVQITSTTPELQGKLQLNASISLAQGELTVQQHLHADNFNINYGTTSITNLSGHLPFSLQFYFSPAVDRLVLVRNIPVGNGVLALKTATENILELPPRPIYYDLLRPYRKKPGLSIVSLKMDALTATNIEFDCTIKDGIFAVDHFSISSIGGDAKGEMWAQLSPSSSIRLATNATFAGIDASVLTDIPKGPNSEINGDMQLQFELAQFSRNIDASFNLTKIGGKTFDRFLLALDPQEQQDSIQSIRSKLWMVDVDTIALRIKYENLKMHLKYKSFIGIPGTFLSYRPIDPEPERINISTHLDNILGPIVDEQLAPLLGWKTQTSMTE